MGKEKKEKRKSENLDDTQNSQDSKESWEQKLQNMNAISKPLASRKLTKKICKTIKKANGFKHTVKGIREVQKTVRKGGKGLVIFAGDISPIDVYSHMPVACEDAGLPYCYVPSREDIGSALGKSGCIIVMVKRHDDYADLYDEMFNSAITRLSDH
ncbi:NHP2-like protein [Mya arenaria]|uniref:H/ACA ribonucleoprotein complex subunit 2 n=1 Tax=Mya arenaria TaxID=6604 RepID=A0ABY7FLK0_MYAAR|nr:NHP2-like protein [Mya arenaria]